MISHRTARAYAAFTSSCGPFVLAIAAAERLLARLFITHLREEGGWLPSVIHIGQKHLIIIPEQIT